MKLDVIKFIEETMEEISIKSYYLDSAKIDIELLLEYYFSKEDYFLNINSRVKSPDSVKEKILKQDLYKDYDTAEKLIDGISDLIGVRIECRFISDEEKVYLKLLDIFNIDLGGGYYACSKNEKVSLKLDDPQPQYQKNGFEIYKLDGKYFIDGRYYNFELQIKSLVNNFWGDIEHRILYKNYNYLLSEGFIKDMMSSIKENLSLIDKQLSVVYDHVFNLELNSYKGTEQIKDVLKKMTYDIYFHKIRNQLGFVVDFRSIVDLIVDYIFIQETKEGERVIGKNFLSIINRLSKTLERKQNFDEKIEYDGEIVFDSPLEEKLGNKILSVINKDFRWNIFFRIIFDLEGKKDFDVIKKFVKYLLSRFEKIVDQSLRGAKFTNGNYDEIKDFICQALVDSFIVEMNVEYLDDFTLISLKDNLSGYLMGIISEEHWEINKFEIREAIFNYRPLDKISR